MTMGNHMSSRTRLEAVFNGATPDRTPILGGWIACTDHICSITRKTLTEYWGDPLNTTIEAYKILGADGLVDVYVPKHNSDFRFIDKEDYWHTESPFSIEEAIEKIDGMPDPERIESEFDFDHEYATFMHDLQKRQSACGDMVYMPAQWDNIPRLLWSELLGYENLFLILGLYPAKIVRLIELSAVQAHLRNKVLARAVADGFYPHAVLFGEDICNQRGLMISPEFVEKYYMPNIKYSIQPLIDVNCRPVWHSDGNVLPILDMLIDCGFKGFQGFQTECGVELEYVVKKRTRDGEPLIIFGPLSVATDLVHLSPSEVRQKVRWAIDICQDSARLIMFTSNTINPDVPLENIYAMYQEIHS